MPSRLADVRDLGLCALSFVRSLKIREEVRARRLMRGVRAMGSSDCIGRRPVVRVGGLEQHFA